MKYAVNRTNKGSGEVKYLGGKPANWPDDHVSRGSLLTDDLMKAYRWGSYPDAMAAKGVLAAQSGTEDFDYEVIEVP